MSNPYSTSKILYHPSHLHALHQGKFSSPLHVQLIPTNVCNQGCLFCSYRQAGYSSNETFDARQSIPTNKLMEIVDSCETMGVRAIQLTGGGEPTCHPSFLSLCDTILNCGIDLALVTNGSRLTESHLSCLQKAKWVRVSIDAGCAATYAKIRRVEPRIYERVRDNIRILTEQKEHPTVGVGFVVNKDNWKEIIPAARAAWEDGADNIRFSAVFQDQGAEYFKDFRKEAEALCKKAEAMSTEDFKVTNLFNDRLDDLDQGRPDYSDCWISHLCTYIGADMNVYRCCVYAYNHRGLIGSIQNRSLTDLWLDKDTQDALWQFNSRSCDRCMFNAKNISIQEAIKNQVTIIENPAPDHVNFI